MADKTIGLGDIAEDTITKYRGVVIAFTTHITGCDRLTLQAPVDKDGKIPDGYGFDITTLKLISKGAVKPIGRELPTLPQAEEKPGGPPTRQRNRTGPHARH